jgi:hypothetical protein
MAVATLWGRIDVLMSPEEALLNPARLYTAEEVRRRECPVPATAGVYAWYFPAPPSIVPTAGCHVRDSAVLLYVGISPKAPPVDGGPSSRQNIRSRIRYHYRGNAAGSTLRLTLGSLLAEDLGIHLRRVGSGYRMTFGLDGEARLSQWMAQHAQVVCTAVARPWKVEEETIRSLVLPLNLDQNRHSPLHPAYGHNNGRLPARCPKAGNGPGRRKLWQLQVRRGSAVVFGWNELGALGSLMGGTFTALALGGTLWLLVREGKQIREANQRRDAERRDDERRQARLVLASLDHGPDSQKDQNPSPAEYSSVYVRVFNHSDEPIWDAKVSVPGREARPLLYERVDPHSSELNGWLDAPADWYLMNVGAGCPGTPHWIPLEVSFVDNSGRRWRRSGRGEPLRLTDSEGHHPPFVDRR